MRALAALILTTAVAAASACSGYASPNQPLLGATAAKAYLDEMIRIMETNSLHRAKINWTDFRSGVFGRTPSAQTIADTYPAILSALRLLGDNHSLYVRPNGQTITAADRGPCEVPEVPDAAVPADIGYLRVRGLNGSVPAPTAFADALQDTIRAADRDGLAGWIVDLRGNTGGNMWPMIAGVGPVLGEGVTGFFIDPDGLERAWGYRSGAAWIDATDVQTVTSPYTLKRAQPRVAVLTNRRISSSGEATTVAFRARPGTRSFGTHTCGVSTVNRAFPMSDGATLQLTVAVMADRARTKYGDVIVPDEIISDSDAAVARAIAWLREGR
jgi:carboxyl-terminal processing protease